MPAGHTTIGGDELTNLDIIRGTAPELRFEETDQTDPAGRYRMGVTADGFLMERSGAAGWANALGSASNFVFFQYDRTNTVLLLQANESNSWYVQLLAGAGATPGTNAAAYVQGHATTPSIDLQTGNGAGAALVSRLLVGGGAGTPDIDINTARMDFNGNAVAGFAVIRGNGTADIQIAGNKVATDATARNIGVYLLDPATDTETLLVQFTANALTPTIDLQDDLLLRIGTTGDTGIANVSAGLAANTASAGTLEGTVVNPIALAANSLVIGNITNDGDILIAVSKAGNSHMAFMADGSTGDTLLGAPTGQSVDVYVAGTKVLDVAANLATYEAAAGASNQRLLVSNTSNTAATSEHAIIEASVGGTTTIGHPQVRWTIPGGTSWYAGPQNNDSDIFKIGTGASLGSAAYLAIDGRTSGVAANLQFTFNTNNVTASDGATAGTDVVRIAAHTVTLAGSTTVTSFHAMLDVRAMTINQSGGAVTVNEAAGVGAFTVTAGASVTLTHSSAFRSRTGGAAVNLSGFYAEAQTAGTTGNYQILLAVSAGAAPALADHVGFTARDTAVGDTRFYIATELGSDIILGNDILRFAAATGIIGIGATTVLSMTTAGLALGALNLTMTGTIAATGARVTQSYHTNITSTNAVTVDSSETVKHDMAPYLGDALAVVRGMDVITFRHDEWLDSSEELKLGIRAESVKESLALRMLKREQRDYLGLNLYGLATLHTRAIQQVDAYLGMPQNWNSTVEERLTAVEEANRILRRQLVAAGIVPEE